ncbi:GNAT family N-acetyltransferase [Streptomyces sp. NPDC020379]|uniref:GNAT family N-acetyltransferase n=1 Tax=Streptomyces sp. NPDC020379 TaxID=3365071 RepID=UPI0037AAE148
MTPLRQFPCVADRSERCSAGALATDRARHATSASPRSRSAPRPCGSRRAQRPRAFPRAAEASFLVDPAHQGKGIGRALGEYVIDWSRAEGFRGIQFNAVVEANPAVYLWRSLGFEVLGTVPEAFRHPEDGLVGLHVMHRRL